MSLYARGLSFLGLAHGLGCPPREVCPLPLGLDRLVRRDLRGLLQMRRHRRFELFIDAEILVETVDFVQKPLTRFVVLRKKPYGGPRPAARLALETKDLAAKGRCNAP